MQSTEVILTSINKHKINEIAATLRWFTAGGAIRIAVRQLSQTWKLRHYDVIDDVITRKLWVRSNMLECDYSEMGGA